MEETVTTTEGFIVSGIGYETSPPYMSRAGEKEGCLLVSIPCSYPSGIINPQDADFLDKEFLALELLLVTRSSIEIETCQDDGHF